MELPHIKQNRALKECNQLDRLPVKCDQANKDNNISNINRHAAIGGGGGEQYEYETVLAKILNEKKLALARSPDVIRFLCDVKPHQVAHPSGIWHSSCPAKRLCVSKSATDMQMLL